MSVSDLIEAVEVGGFGGGGVVAPASGDVQVAGVFDGRDDGGADGGQVGGPAAGAAGGGSVFAERRVPDVVVRLDGPVLADRAARSGAVAWALVMLVTAQAVWREVLPVVVSSRRPVILMAWRPWGKSRRPTWAVFRVLVRPCPASRAELPAGTWRQ
jgi:hypothetical protein